MRDPERIDRILEQIRYLWKKYPDLKLGQILLNAVDSYDLYMLEDEILMQKLEETFYTLGKLYTKVIKEANKKNLTHE